MVKKPRYFLSSLPLLMCFIICSLFVAVVGCENKKNRVQDETPTLKAYRLIDEQRTDEAIELLEIELDKTPENIEYKSVLASAYAHKAGIKIQKLIPVITQTERLKKLKEKFVEIDPKASMSQKLNASAINISLFFIKASSVVDAYAAVPILTAEQATYLKHSISLLNSIGKKITSDNVLYRAVLEVILFKHILVENLIGDFVAPGDLGTSKCRVDVGRLNNTFITLGKLLIDIFNDLGYIRPEESVDMQKLSQATSEAISNLTLATTSLAILDEASHILLKQALFQGSFGKIIRCDSQ